MLLCCILRDACEWHNAATATADCCRAADGTCLAHWDDHEVPASRYRELGEQLVGSSGVPYGIPFPLGATENQVLAAAVRTALAFRAGRDGVEDVALVTAYTQIAAALGS
jgi:hypothetical protein